MNVEDYITFNLYLPKTKEKFFVSNIYELQDLFNNLIDLKHTLIEYRYKDSMLFSINKCGLNHLSLCMYYSSFTDILTYNNKTIGYNLLLFLADQVFDYRISLSIQKFISDSKAINPIGLNFEALGSMLAKAKMGARIGESILDDTDSKIHTILLDNKLSNAEKAVKLRSI